jgi:hypothetical protein
MRVPRREELDGARVDWLKQGGPTKADLSIVDLGQGPMVVKDFANKVPWVRLIGRFQISRECKAYRLLGPMPGLPRLWGRIDAHALAMEKIEARELVFLPDRATDGAARHEQLVGIVERMHRAGLYHLDLRGIDNVMLTDDGRVFVLDLAGSFWVRPGGWADRLLGGWLEMTDRAALLKWKTILEAGEPTDEEREFLHRYRFWRSLWIFNPKRRRRD